MSGTVRARFRLWPQRPWPHASSVRYQVLTNAPHLSAVLRGLTIQNYVCNYKPTPRSAQLPALSRVLQAMGVLPQTLAVKMGTFSFKVASRAHLGSRHKLAPYSAVTTTALASSAREAQDAKTDDNA
mmetsp:Transcript_12801/g.25102  ORF Transcript_12801/g.25102 Transcript_12801/m.25102 type:complete len:127 (-) Transcript_12801:1735-2115(-)